MFIMTPHVVRAVHEDRRRQLIHEAEVHRLHREFRSTRPGERRGWSRALARFRHQDAKVARLASSWLGLDRRAALRLASVADEVEMSPGTVLVPGRHSFVGLDEAHRGLVVTTGTAASTLTSTTTVLVLTTSDLEQIAQEVPRVASLLATARRAVPTNSVEAGASVEPGRTAARRGAVRAATSPSVPSVRPPARVRHVPTVVGAARRR